MFNNYNPYFGQQQMPQQTYQRPVEQQYIPTPSFTKPNGLQGKQVDSMEVVKATDVPFDGSISYFPLMDGSAIITKQLQNDGTSKITIFKPIEEQNSEIPYITQEELKSALNELNLDELDDIKEELRELKKQIKEIKKK